MMERRHYGMMLLVATMLLAGCMTELNEELPLSAAPDGATADGYVPFGLTASVAGMADGPMPAARRATRAATGVQSTQFEAGETFYAYFPSGVRIGVVAGTNTTFELKQAEGGAEGVSDGSTTPATQPYFAAGVSTVRVHAYYPQTVTNATTSFTVQLNQTDASGYKQSDLMYATTEVTVDKSTETSATGSLTFTHKMAKIIVNATAGQGINTIRKVRIIGGNKTIAIAAPATTDENTTAYLGTTTSDAITAADDGCVRLYDDATGVATVSCAALIPPQRIPADGSAETCFLQVTTDQGTATYSLSGKTFASGSAYTYNITVSLAAIGLTTNITDWDSAGTQYLYNIGTANANVEAVDLGLSVLWANMNVGAASETDYGLYFMWGDVIGRSGTVSSGTTAADGFSFDWTNYKWNPSDDGQTFTRYTGSDYTKLLSADDAATACWGSGWRMPTKTEMEELVNNTDQEWTTINSVAGRKFMKKSDHDVYIFLPAAGDRRSASFRNQGSGGTYWSSTLFTDYPSIAWTLNFSSSNASVYNYYFFRYYGFTVRAVQSN